MSNMTEYKMVGYKWGSGGGGDSSDASTISQHLNEYGEEGWYIIDWKFADNYYIMFQLGRDKAEWAEEQLNADQSISSDEE